ncbi:MAG: hypothetical protein J0J06_00825 [Sphingomonas sp.]|uniref:hypothetical protein n=1 Tax=Sphingomonas sp. TaxID=28214 RepID=UPI001ACF85D8|nr:hypothetical protein [Sphingomonas sp.]MBN8813970.1 hypothetical protein [Sphingomonas sp.]
MRSILSRLRANPKWSFAGFFGLLAFLWDRFNDYQSGSGLMVGVLGANWFQTVIHSPWFTVFGLGLVLLSLWRIGHLADSANRASEERNALARDNAIAPILDVATRYEKFRLAVIADREIDRGEAAIEEYKRVLDEARHGGPKHWPSIKSILEIRCDAAFSGQHRTRALLGLGAGGVTPRRPVPILQPVEGSLGRIGLFDPTENTAFFNEHQLNVEAIENSNAAYRDLARERRESLANLLPQEARIDG